MLSIIIIESSLFHNVVWKDFDLALVAVFGVGEMG